MESPTAGTVELDSRAPAGFGGDEKSLHKNKSQQKTHVQPGFAFQSDNQPLFEAPEVTNRKKNPNYKLAIHLN